MERKRKSSKKKERKACGIETTVKLFPQNEQNADQLSFCSQDATEKKKNTDKKKANAVPCSTPVECIGEVVVTD